AAFERSAVADEKNKAQADDLLVGLLHVQLGQPEAAIGALEKVVASDVALPDKLIKKYLSGFTMAVTYAGNINADLPLDSVTAGGVLGECYRKLGRLDEATGLVQQLATHSPDPLFLLSLAELYSEQSDYDDLDDLMNEPEVQKTPWSVRSILYALQADSLL